MIDTTLASDNSSRFRKNRLDRKKELIMTIDDKIRDEKLKYDIHREAAKVSASSPGKIDKYEFLTGEERLPFDQNTIIEQAKFNYSPLGKTFEIKIKAIKDQDLKQVQALRALKLEENKEVIKSIEGTSPKEMRANEIKNKIHEVKKWEEKIKREDLKCKTKNYTYDFQQYETIRSFDESAYTRKAIIAEAEEDQSNLLENLVKFNNKSGPKKKEGKDKKK